MMTPVGRLVLLRSIDKSALVNAMAWVTVPALVGPVIGPPLGGFITTYFSWHWIFLINIPIGLVGIVLATRFIDRIVSEDPEPVRSLRDGAGRARASAARLRRFRSRASISCRGRWSLALVAVGPISMTLYVIHARRTACPGARSLAASASHHARRRYRRLHLPSRHRRAAVPAAAADAGRLRPVAVPVRAGHALHRGRRHGHEDGHSDAPAAIWLPPRAHHQCGDQRRPGRDLRDLHAGRVLCMDRRRADAGGFFRSLQFTSINTLAYADVDFSA